jgi:hypothetical protein|tara:strand:+ start:176 stop:394 length:219 start_codon:yes stop_codon:yes gene_type:complete
MKSFTQIQRTAWSLTALLLLMVSNVFAAEAVTTVSLAPVAGPEHLAELKKLSPNRFALWARILKPNPAYKQK